MVERVTIDGNEAAARVAHKLSEVIAIYPITPASRMGELADAWSAGGRANLWGAVPRVVEMQSEAGAAGAVHGAVQAGALTTTFTASQGLLLMLPDMFKMAGELAPVVIHVAARTVATHALSIFGDHSDVMAARTTGFALLCSSSVQEAHDMAAVAHAAALRTRVPFLHFFDGFRISHEINQVALLDDEDLLDLVDHGAIEALRRRALTPDRPVLRGSAQNPDVFFQQREACNPFYDAVPGAVQAAMDRLAERTGRSYRVVEYHGAPDAERVVVVMGSATGALQEAVDGLLAQGERVGVVTVRLFRPFPAAALLAALPATAGRIAVLDRTKEPGATGEPLFQDVVCAVAGSGLPMPAVIGGRYGLSSKEFTPAMAKAVFDELARPAPKPRFTVGIEDDVSHLSLDWDPTWSPEQADVVEAVFYGLGSDGTVGANKNSVKMIADTGRFAQGYFVIDSKKAGSMTVSHLRFGSRPITSPYLIDSARFVACHAIGLLHRVDVLASAAPGATVLLNAPWPAAEVWDHLPPLARRRIRERGLEVFAVDASAVARGVGLGNRTNTVLQTCFFVLSGLMDADAAAAAVKRAVATTYAKRGPEIIARNEAAVDSALSSLARVPIPDGLDDGAPAASPGDPISEIIAGRGDLLPVSALPVDGTFPTATARIEKRSIADTIPVWDPDICIDCAKCALDCPHAAIRMKVYEPGAADGAPDGFRSKPYRSRDLPDRLLTIQVSPDDCTGCGICVEVCPAKSKVDGHRSLEMAPKEDAAPAAREGWSFFEDLPEVDRTLVPAATPKGSQLLTPLFEFSGACAGCGETPYLKLLSQLFGDRALVANATGCSSIYGGNLPTTPWSIDANGRGPAWANSLFEDNAEFGLGLRLGVDSHAAEAADLLRRVAPELDGELVDALLAGIDRSDEAGIAEQRIRVTDLRCHLHELTPSDISTRLDAVADYLVRKSVWIVGGDGWAYDIGFGGLDHVLASGADVNVLVLDTEVYSNTGGQASKSTPRAAVAKFAAAGKPAAKKELGLMAASYGNVYVAQVSLGANEIQAVKAFAEAEAYRGPSLIVAYGHCIEHGIDMATGMSHQHEAVSTGYWPLWRFDPRVGSYRLDCRKPSLELADFLASENRFSALARSHPAQAAELAELARADVARRWERLERLAGLTTG